MRISLADGAYSARGLIASAQQQVNLFSESNPPDSPTPSTDYPTPGLALVANDATNVAAGRCVYAASNGHLYSVAGEVLYHFHPDTGLTTVGYIAAGTGPVKMVDNGLAVLVGDGSSSGWQFNLGSNDGFSEIADGAFYGFTTGDFLDTFMVFNKPQTPQFYVAPSEYVTDGSTPFDALYFADKSSAPDNLAGVAVSGRSIWLIGAFDTEFWLTSGASDFPFQLLSSVYIEYGCAAPYSIAKADQSVLWLAQDRVGRLVAVRGQGYEARRVSNHAVETEWQGYGTTADATAWTYQLGGHTFYALTFPTQDVTWSLDLANGLWHRWAWADALGALHRHRAAWGAAAYGSVYCQDWETGAIYRLDPELGTDAGAPIQRIRSFPHLPQSGNRFAYQRFVADMQAQAGPGFPVTLKWSNDRGATFIGSLTQDLGALGTLTHLSFRRPGGLSRDRVFELSWSGAGFTGLNGAFVEVTEATS